MRRDYHCCSPHFIEFQSVRPGESRILDFYEHFDSRRLSRAQ